MTAVVLDTHVALWWSFFPEKLSQTASSVLADAQTLLFPAIVFWETSLLVRKGRLSLEVPPAAWLRGLRSTARAKVVPISAEIALRADQLSMHDDPSDRFIVATALRWSAALVTKDTSLHATKLVHAIW